MRQRSVVDVPSVISEPRPRACAWCAKRSARWSNYGRASGTKGRKGMTSRSAPRTATWFLYQFGAGLENDAAIGDLAEKYQLGGSRGWYWRQVLSIVIGGLNHDVRRDKAWVWRGIAAAWLIHTLLMVEAGHLLRAYFDVLHQSSTINLFPLVTLKAGNGAVQQWVAVV